MIRLTFIISICFIWASLLSSCDSSTIYEKNLKINSAQWNQNQLAKFTFDIEDSAASYSLLFNFRHGGNYPYKNIYFFSRFKSPSGKMAIDTAQMILADPKGRWLGKGIGDLYDYQFRFKSGKIFPEKGKYELLIEQAMRDQVLPDITDIGITIKKMDSL